MKQYNIALIFLIAALSQCLPILKSEKDDNQSLLALLPLKQPRDSTVCTSKPTTVPDFCAAAEAEYGCSVYEGTDARLDGVFIEKDIGIETLEFSAVCRGYKHNGNLGVYTVNGDNVNGGEFTIKANGNIGRGTDIFVKQAQ